MKLKALGILAIVLLWGDGAVALRSDAGLYNGANAHYRAGRYEEAIGRYQEVLVQGVRNGYVYYNLGNAHFKAGQIGPAILAYERALKLMPGDGDIRANLRFVNALKVDKGAEVEENIVTRFFGAIYRAVSVDRLAVVCSVCLFLMAGVGIARLFSPSRRVVWIGLLVVLGAGLLGGGTLMAFKIDRSGVEEAVILAEEVVGRSGPGEDYLQVFTLHEGTKATIERAERGWLLIRLTNGIGGWLPEEAVERI